MTFRLILVGLNNFMKTLDAISTAFIFMAGAYVAKLMADAIVLVLTKGH